MKVTVSIPQLSGNTRVCPGIHVYVHCCLLNTINSLVVAVVPPSTQHLASRAKPRHFGVCFSLPWGCRMGASRSVIGRGVVPAAQTAPAAGRCKAGCPTAHSPARRRSPHPTRPPSVAEGSACTQQDSITGWVQTRTKQGSKTAKPKTCAKRLLLSWALTRPF